MAHFRHTIRDVIRYRKVFGVPLKTLSKRDGSLVPLFVQKSLNFIREYGLDKEGIFRMSGRATQIDKLREGLDQGKKVFFSDGMDVHSVANLFKQWLRELPEPLLTWQLYDEFLETDSMPQEKKLNQLKILLNERLPRNNRVCFQQMAKLLTEVIENEKKTKLNASSLAVVFAPNILASGDLNLDPYDSASFEGVNNVLKDILLNYHILLSDLEKNMQANEDPALRLARNKQKFKKTASIKLASGVSLLDHQKQEQETKAVDGVTTHVPSNTFVEGVLSQQDSKTQAWTERYFVMGENAITSYRSATEKDKKVKIPFGSIVKISAAADRPFSFQLERKKENLILAANSKEEFIMWLDCLTKAVCLAKVS